MGSKEHTATGKKKLSKISRFHFFRLSYRALLFVMLLIGYVASRAYGINMLKPAATWGYAVAVIFWVVFVIEMVCRLFPSKLESPGCQKQFARNYIRSGRADIIIHDNHATLMALIIWVLFNMVFGALHMAGILDDGLMLLLCSAYSICDHICILFFCPFQSWLLKNKCCTTCRIYNWDFAMIFTPLFFIEKSYLLVLLLLALAILMRWEITFFRHPERFSENTNEYLRCENCKEKLCVHKKQLRRLWQRIEDSKRGKAPHPEEI